MSTQSGIAVSQQLQEAFGRAQAGDVRVLKVLIENEQLVPSSTLTIQGSDVEDFDGIPHLLEPTSSPAYLLVKLDEDSSSIETQWLLATYVPDHAQVRSKMLYSSSKSTLSRQLGDAKFKHIMFASTPDELSSAGFKRFLAHQTSSAPLTDREREMADIREAEGIESQTTGTAVRKSHAGAQLGMPWTSEAEEAISSLAQGKHRIVQLGIDTKDEKIVVLSTSADLALPGQDPSYTFYAHTSGIVFIYCCPDTSPVRWRMIYSSNAQPVVQNAKNKGVDVVKKVETSTPSEITEAYIDAELQSEQAEQISRTGTPSNTAFARPARPGRKR